MTDWHPPRTVEYRERSLSFAVRLVDRFTGTRPDRGVDVSVDEDLATAATNQSGYHLFLDLEAEVVTLDVDGGDRYVDERRRVHLGEDPETADGSDESVVVAAPSEPVVVDLTPTPAYEFPDSTTMVRGHVRDGSGEPVVGARVSLREFEPVVETTAMGEYALWVPASTEAVHRRDGRNVVVVDQLTGGGMPAADGGRGTDPTLVVDPPSGGERTEQIEVAAGTRTVHYVTLE